MTNNPASKLARRIADEILGSGYPSTPYSQALIAAIEREFGPICEGALAVYLQEWDTLDGPHCDPAWERLREALVKLGEKETQ